MADPVARLWHKTPYPRL